MNALVMAVVLGGVIVVSGCTAPSTVDYAEFTQCLADSEVDKYGAYWCPNCQRVKVTFGDAWYNLNYVECDPKCVIDENGNLPPFCNGFESQTDLCLEQGITKYPSWVKNGEIIYVGNTMSELSAASGCPLPE